MAGRSLARSYLRVLGIASVLVLAIGYAPSTSTAADPVAVARAHLMSTLQPGALAGGLTFDDVSYRESRGGRHVRFEQRLQGVRVLGRDVTVSLAKDDDRITLVLGEPLTSIPALKAGGVSISPDEAVSRGRAHAGGTPIVNAGRATYAYYFDGSILIPAWEARTASTNPIGDWRTIVDATSGAILSSQNLVVFDHPDASGQVFDPNPVVTAGGPNIPGSPPLTDCDSPTTAESARFASEYRTRALPGILTGQGQLKGEYVDLTAPFIPGAYLPAGQANDLTHSYTYTCGDPRFEEVMVYHHVDKAQRFIQGLGFTGASAILDSPLPAHAHYNAECNAFFSDSFFFGYGIHFGDGCPGSMPPLPVDTAEDADVIVHEYGHALQWEAVGGFFGVEGSAVAEGFADFFSAVINGGPCMFEWTSAVGYPDLPCARRVDDGQYFNKNTLNISYHRYYPEDIHTDEHATGLIWATALWDMTVALGDNQAARERVLELALQGFSYVTPSSPFADYAAGVLQANTDLYAGADQATIQNAFKTHGICWAAGACISGMHRVNYTTLASPVNACTVLVRQNGDGSGANGIEGNLSCTTARAGDIVSGNLNQSGSPTIVSVLSQFTSPPITVSSSGPIANDGASGGPGTWVCTVLCADSGDWTSTRFRRTASSFLSAATGGTVTTALGDTLTIPAGSAVANATFIIEIAPLESAPNGVLTLSRAYRISPPGTTFAPPGATMVFNYSGDIAAGLDPDHLTVMMFNDDSGQWEPVGGEVDPDAQTITVILEHLSEYTLFDCTTGLVNTDGDGYGNACDIDDDDDGCTDLEEAGSSEFLGGQRDPLNNFDFFDVTGDGLIDFSDTLDVLSYFGDAGLPATPGDFRDRDVGGPNGWNLVASDTGVDFTDALNSLGSFGHSCDGT